MLELPRTMDEVTSEWLQQAVGDHPAFAGARIADITKTPVGVGIGQVGDLARIALTYAGAAPGAPKSVVVKLQAAFAPMRAVGVRYEMYARETGFYRTLATETNAPTPTMYFIDWRPEQELNTLVMQDLCDWHWPDQLVGATEQQAERCIDALAHVTAGHWNADFSAHPWLPGPDSEVFQRIVADYQLCVPVTLERLHRFMTPAHRDACARIADNFSWIIAQMNALPHVLTHVDCRLENFVFDGPSADQLALIDWQLVARMHPGYDFAYFVGTSMTTAARRAQLAALTQRYLDGLRKHGVADYDEQKFARDVRLGTMTMTMISVIGGASFDIDNPRSLELFGSIIERSLSSVLDYDALALLP